MAVGGEFKIKVGLVPTDITPAPVTVGADERDGRGHSGACGKGGVSGGARERGVIPLHQNRDLYPHP